jgi:hypothetical protein
VSIGIDETFKLAISGETLGGGGQDETVQGVGGDAGGDVRHDCGCSGQGAQVVDILLDIFLYEITLGKILLCIHSLIHPC